MNTYFYSAWKLSRSFCDRLDSENIYVSQAFCRKSAWSEIEKTKEATASYSWQWDNTVIWKCFQ